MHKAKEAKPRYKPLLALPAVFDSECGYFIDEPAITQVDSEVTCKNCLSVMGAKAKEPDVS